MGAQFQIATIRQTERANVKAAFEIMQHEDRYENGHSYSGGFGMARGIKFRDDMAFPDENAAYDWLGDNTEKWENAVAVRLVIDGRHEGYVIGAVCAS